MADKRADDTQTSSEPITPEQSLDNTNKKRKLRQSPTIRQQSEKAAASANNSAPHQRGIVVTILLAPFRLIGLVLKLVWWPFAKVGRFLGRYKFFRAIGYIFVPPYFRSAWRELRQVTWPNFRQTRDLTVAVIIFSIIFGLIVAGVDFVLDKVFREFILK